MYKIYDLGRKYIYVFAGDEFALEENVFDRQTYQLIQNRNINVLFSKHCLYETDSYTN